MKTECSICEGVGEYKADIDDGENVTTEIVSCEFCKGTGVCQ